MRLKKDVGFVPPSEAKHLRHGFPLIRILRSRRSLVLNLNRSKLWCDMRCASPRLAHIPSDIRLYSSNVTRNKFFLFLFMFLYGSNNSFYMIIRTWDGVFLLLVLLSLIIIVQIYMFRELKSIKWYFPQKISHSMCPK